jgi:hypothetical protein
MKRKRARPSTLKPLLIGWEHSPLVEFGDGCADGGFFDDLAVVASGDYQSGNAAMIDQTRHTIRALVDTRQAGLS